MTHTRLLFLALLRAAIAVDNAEIVSDATEESQRRPPLMRMEMQSGKESSINLGARGELMEVSAHRVDAARSCPAAPGTWPLETATCTSADAWCAGVQHVPFGSVGPPYDRYAYVKGTPESNDCLDPTLHEYINSIEECRYAARQAGANHSYFEGYHFNIGFDENNQTRLDEAGANAQTGEWGLFNTHPRGCFMNRSDPLMWFFNPGPAETGTVALGPRHPGGNSSTGTGGGTIVCRRMMYRNGAHNTDNCCPTSGTSEQYQKIINVTDLSRGEYDCRTAASILTMLPTTDSLFPIVKSDDPNKPAWARSFDKNPTGCFIRLQLPSNSNGQIFYSYPHPDDATKEPTCVATNTCDSDPDEAGNSAGVPLCKIAIWDESR